MRRRRHSIIVLAAAAAAWLGCRPPAPPPGDGPRLVLLVVVDQLCPDQLERFEPYLAGGLRRLTAEGTVFTHARHLHAETTTGPGHATVVTGLHPSRHGIIGNYWYVPAAGEWIYCCEDEAGETSPARLAASTLGDWIAQASPRSKIFAVSGKDRTAVLLGGHSADGAYWYDWEGGWESSHYYDRGEPAWLAGFNGQRLLDGHFGSAWEPLAVPPKELAGLGIRDADLGPLEQDFPHTFGGPGLVPGRGFNADLFTSPWLDRNMALFAEALIEHEELGRDGAIDLLALGFSALDAVGHTYGPQSREVMDTVVRLDQALERLLGYLEREIGLEHVVIGLTSDHGAVPVPELRVADGLPGRRVDAEVTLCLQSVGHRLSDKFGDDDWLLPGPFLNPEALARSGVSRQVLERETALLAEACPAVAKVWTRTEMAAGLAAAADPSAGGGGDEAARAVARSFHPERSPDFRIQFEPYFVPIDSVASTHGSLYDYDTRVPMIVWSDRVASRVIDRPVGTVDLAPTLAALSGIPVPEGLDGEDLSPLMAGAEASGPALAAREP